MNSFSIRSMTHSGSAVQFCFFVCLFWGESLGFLECYFILAVGATMANKELSLCSTTRLHSLDHGLFMRCFGLVSSSLKHLATSNTKIIVFIISQFTLFQLCSHSLSENQQFSILKNILKWDKQSSIIKNNELKDQKPEEVSVGRKTQSDHKAVGILNHVKLFHMFLCCLGVTINHLANRPKGYILIQGHRKIQTKGLIEIKSLKKI